jgi:hypothetical protein
LPVSRSQRPTLGASKKTKIDLSPFSISDFNFEPPSSYPVKSTTSLSRIFWFTSRKK